MRGAHFTQGFSGSARLSPGSFVVAQLREHHCQLDARLGGLEGGGGPFEQCHCVLKAASRRFGYSGPKGDDALGEAHQGPDPTRGQAAGGTLQLGQCVMSAILVSERAAGDLHHQALRALGNRLVGILHGCLSSRSVYDEDTAWAHRPKEVAAA